MEYEHNRNASEEILRLLIPRMAEHPAAFTPQNYAVWYEYSTGINPALSETITKLIDNGERINDDTIERLYLKYVSECNMDVEWALREDIQHLPEKLAESTKVTDIQAHQFDTSLHESGARLKQNLDPPKLVALINNMASDTSKMIDSMQNLESELVASKQKVEKLHQEPQSARGEALIDPLTGILNRRGFENSAKLTFSNHESLSNGCSRAGCLKYEGRPEAGFDQAQYEGIILDKPMQRRDMSGCCSTPGGESRHTRKHQCPSNGKEYSEVSARTVVHHIKESWTWTQTASHYFFCDDPECDVVYFGDDGSSIRNSQLRTLVGVKENKSDSLLCYCFGVSNAESLRNPIIKDYVKAQTKAGLCSCETSNPSGRCCLKDFPREGN